MITATLISLIRYLNIKVLLYVEAVAEQDSHRDPQVVISGSLVSPDVTQRLVVVTVNEVVLNLPTCHKICYIFHFIKFPVISINYACERRLKPIQEVLLSDILDLGGTFRNVTQVIDLGVIAHPGSYLRDVWNLMGALVVVCASISFVFEMT